VGLFFAASAVALPPTKAEVKEVKKLMQDAQKALKKRDFGVAINLLEQAEAKIPSTENGLALSRAHEVKGDLVEAWRTAERAKTYGPTAKESKLIAAYEVKLEQALYQDYAFLELTVVPPDAIVREKTDGQWSAPHRHWVKRSYSTLRVEAPGFIPATVQWHHPTGHPDKKTVELVPASAYGRIRISGTPAGALILVDESALGSLPQAETRLLPPGRYTVRVEKDKYLASTQTAIVTAGGVTQVEVRLEEAEGAGAKLLKSKKFWGWMSVGVGVAAIATSGALLAIAAEHQQQAEDLNATHVSGYEDYSAEYDSITSDIAGLSTGGWVALGVGLVAAGAGTALLIVDSLGSPSGTAAVSEPSWQLFPTPNGAGAMVRF
jgi:hypothetical protein